jgi:hypothetical protein
MLTTDKSSPSDMKMAGVGDKMLPTIWWGEWFYWKSFTGYG